MTTKIAMKKYSRAAVMLLMMLLTTTTAWAASGNWSNYKASSFSSASSYDGTVNIASGQAFVTNDATPAVISGTITDMSLINGKTLTPTLVGSGTSSATSLRAARRSSASTLSWTPTSVRSRSPLPVWLAASPTPSAATSTAAATR